MKIILKRILLISIFTAVIFICQSNSEVQAALPTDGYSYNIKNKASGKYLNVCSGVDANGTNVDQCAKDGTIEQDFALVKDSNYTDIYKIHAFCSNESFNRVIDVKRSSGTIKTGCNVQIYANNDDPAQQWKIVDEGSGYYSIKLKSNTNLALTSYGTGNGTGTGTTPTSTGNVFLKTYTGTANQLWKFENTPRLWGYFLVNKTTNKMKIGGSTKYANLMLSAGTTWNSYKSGVLQLTLTGTTSSLDAVVSDYSASGSTMGVTTYSSRSIRLNTRAMDASGVTDNNRKNVCLHELGHALGLDHRHDWDGIMYKYNSPETTLKQQDKWNYDKSYVRF